LAKLFSADLTAMQIAYLTGLNRNTVNAYLRGMRERIAAYCEEQSPFSGTVEVDESWFGARRVKGKRGRGAYGKTTVFGIYERNGHVHTEIVPDCSKATLQAIIRGKVAAESIINSDGWRGYNGLVDIGYGHFRVDHGKDEFARGKTHVNGIEGFWGIAKVRLAKFRGMAKSTFYLHLKETEFRYNHRNDNIYKILLSLLRQNPLN
jgi:transposase